jgi:hypothetical protein
MAEALQVLASNVYKVPPVRKYVLLRLDEIISAQPGVTFDHKIITVEHVLPQNPKTGSDWMEDFNDDEREYWTDRLANLVLLNRRKNSEAQNFDFSDKKTKYFSGEYGVATFGLTVQVLAFNEWTPSVLVKREQYLVGLLQKEWQLVESSSTDGG